MTLPQATLRDLAARVGRPVPTAGCGQDLRPEHCLQGTRLPEAPWGSGESCSAALIMISLSAVYLQPGPNEYLFTPIAASPGGLLSLCQAERTGLCVEQPAWSPGPPEVGPVSPSCGDGGTEGRVTRKASSLAERPGEVCPGFEGKSSQEPHSPKQDRQWFYNRHHCVVQLCTAFHQ